MDVNQLEADPWHPMEPTIKAPGHQPTDESAGH